MRSLTKFLFQPCSLLGNFVLIALILFSISSCRREEQSQTMVITTTLKPTVEITPEIDPTITTLSEQVTSTTPTLSSNIDIIGNSDRILFNLDNDKSDMLEGVMQEIAYMGGGGPGGCSYKITDEQIIVDIVAIKGLHFIEVCIGWSPTTTFSATLTKPTGESISLDLREDILSSVYSYTSYAIQLDDIAGIYEVALVNLETGFSINKEIALKATLRREDITTGSIVHLSQFEPHENVYLLAYDVENLTKNFMAKLVGIYLYQMNSEGYLMIEVKPDYQYLRFAALGEVSDFTREPWIGYRLKVLNNSPKMICKIGINSTSTGNSIQEFNIQYSPIKPGQLFELTDLFDPGFYDIWASDCNGLIIKRSNGIEFVVNSIWEIQ